MGIKKTLKKFMPNSMIGLYNKIIRFLNKNTREKKYEAKISKIYKKCTGYEMDFNSPKTFTQKQQWIKLYSQSELKTRLSDKYAVRQWIKDEIGEEYLIPLIEIDGKDHFYNAYDIDFEKLPNRFVIQANHGSGMIYIVKDKNSLTEKQIKKMKKTMNKWLKINYSYNNGYELFYKDIKPCLIVEEYLEISDDLPDYKFICFNGEPKYVWVDQGRFLKHERIVFNTEWNKAGFKWGNFGVIDNLEKPINYNEMLEVANKLSNKFDLVRVDLYNLNGKIYFGEMTFSSGSGFELPSPIKYDLILGDMLKLDLSVRENNYKYRKK